MNKEELAKHLSKNDGLDRGGEIRTAADEDGNVFVFSENKYGCPVIDVLVEGQGKETAYFKTGKGEITVYEETGRMLEETDPREAAISGRWYPETVPVQKEVPDVMTVQLMKGNDKLGSYYVGHDTTKSGRESLGQLIWKEDIGSYHSDSINVELLRKRLTLITIPKVLPAMSNASNKRGKPPDRKKCRTWRSCKRLCIPSAAVWNKPFRHDKQKSPAEKAGDFLCTENPRPGRGDLFFMV